MDEKEYNSKFTSECKTWIVVIKFPDMETHTENVTSFGPFDNKNKALSWAFQVYEEEHVSIEVIPVNEPFDVNEFKKFDPDNPMIMTSTDTGKKATLSIVPPNDEEIDEHQPTEQDEWLDYDPDC